MSQAVTPRNGSGASVGARSWFTGAEPRNEEEAEFLAVLREDRWNWAGFGLAPERTSALDLLVPIVVTIEMPWIRVPMRQVELGYWTTRPDITLEGHWSDGTLLDNPHPDEDLLVGAMPMSPAGCADLAGRWLQAQLSRPVELREWLTRRGDVVATAVVLGDTDRTLGRTGRFWRRRGAPDRVTALSALTAGL